VDVLLIERFRRFGVDPAKGPSKRTAVWVSFPPLQSLCQDLARWAADPDTPSTVSAPKKAKASPEIETSLLKLEGHLVGFWQTQVKPWGSIWDASD